MLRRMVVMAAGVALLAAACGTGSVDEAEVASAPPPADAPAAEADVPEAVSPPTVAIKEPAEEADAPEEGDGSNEGIQVHGHWTIEVTNPDGSLATRTEFENALTQPGAQSLAAVLTGNFALAEGSIDLTVESEELTGCNNDDGDFVFPYNSVASRVLDGSVSRWTASFTALTADQILSVATCTSGSAGKDGPVFTEKTLDSPVPIVEGQEIEITVEISFS